VLITGPPTLIVGGLTRNGSWHLSASVTWRIYNVTHQRAARGGPVVLRPVRSTPCSEHVTYGLGNKIVKHFGT